jgi:hypothetical protein
VEHQPGVVAVVVVLEQQPHKHYSQRKTPAVLVWLV